MNISECFVLRVMRISFNSPVLYAVKNLLFCLVYLYKKSLGGDVRPQRGLDYYCGNICVSMLYLFINNKFYNYSQNGEMKDLQLDLLFSIKEKVNGRI